MRPNGEGRSQHAICLLPFQCMLYVHRSLGLYHKAYKTKHQEERRICIFPFRCCRFINVAWTPASEGRSSGMKERSGTSSRGFVF